MATQLPKCIVQITQQIVGGLRGGNLERSCAATTPADHRCGVELREFVGPAHRGRESTRTRIEVLLSEGYFGIGSPLGGQEHQRSLKRPRPKRQADDEHT